MRFTYRTALAVLAVALVSAVGASAALAAPEWYSSTSKPAAEWQQGGAKITEAAATKWKGNIKLADVKAGSGSVECEGSGEGTAGPGAVGTVTKLTLSKCAIVASGACETMTEVKAVDLPWHSELSISASAVNDVISEDGKGLPGFKFLCKTKELGTIGDTCTEKTLRTSTSNGSGGVNTTFNGESFTCSIGGKGGLLEGSQLIEATKGSKLEAKIVEGTYSKLTSSHEVNGTGSLTIEDKGYGPMGVAKCEVETKGTIGTGGKGTITSYIVKFGAGSCEPTGTCEGVVSVEPIGTPWNTELYESEGAIRDRIVSGGGEAPAWRFLCKTFGGELEDRCSLAVSPEILNGLEGNVFALFSESLTKTTCKHDSKEGEAVWRGELKLAPTSGAIKAEK